MKITNVELFVLKSEGLYNNPEGSEEPSGPTYMGLVKVSTDEGLCGYSDIETCASVAKACVDAPKWSQEEGMECFDGLASLVGRARTRSKWNGSGIECTGAASTMAAAALRFRLSLPSTLLCGTSAVKRIGQPIHILLGGKWRSKVRAYGSTLFRPTPEAIREAVQQYIDQGFTAVKFGWGVFGKDFSRDVKLVEAAREALGDERDLLVDTGWFVERTPKEAIQVVRAIEPFRPFLVEELLHPEDYDGYRRVADSVDTRIACGEQEATEWGFDQLIHRGGVDVLQPDLDAMRWIHGGTKDRPYGRTGQPSGDPAFLVQRPVDCSFTALGGVSTSGGVRRVQYFGRSARVACS